MFTIPVWQVMEAEFVVYVFTYLGIHASTDDENVFVADDCCAGVAIKRSYHHPRLYFLDAI